MSKTRSFSLHLLCVSISLVACKQTQVHLDAPGVHVTDSNALVMDVTIPAETVYVDQQVPVEFILKNKSNRTLWVDRALIAADHPADGRLGVSVQGPDSTILPFTCIMDRGNPDFGALKAGDVLPVRANLTTCFGVARHGAGTYKLTAKFRPTNEGCHAPAGSECFYGEAVAETTIVVKTATPR